MTPPNQSADLPSLQRWLAVQSRRSCWKNWRWQLRESLHTDNLGRLGLLSATARRAARLQPARVTPYLLKLALTPDGLDASDPIVRQWMPDAREWRGKGGTSDPFDEMHASPVPGVVQRFRDRVLVLVSNVCATNCRHCTRRHTLAESAVVRSTGDLRRVVAFLRASPLVREVILSGGDPFLLGDAALLRMVRAMTALPQIDAVRIGTRVPVVLPMRVTPALARGLGASGRVWINTQFNTVREITPDSIAACGRLVDAGIPVSNQSVLLRGINDTTEEMVALCAALQRNRVRPYYVFLCDDVSGTGHLRVSRRRARAIADGVARRLGGLAVPRFVTDLHGTAYKVTI
jgi:lysine 2,3-aminomutase